MDAVDGVQFDRERDGESESGTVAVSESVVTVVWSVAEGGSGESVVD